MYLPYLYLDLDLSRHRRARLHRRVAAVIIISSCNGINDNDRPTDGLRIRSAGRRPQQETQQAATGEQKGGGEGKEEPCHVADYAVFPSLEQNPMPIEGIDPCSSLHHSGT